MRSPVIAHSNVKDHLALLEFIGNMSCAGEHIKLSNLGFRGRSEDFNSQFGQPSLEAFVQFSSELAKSLPHEMFKASAIDVVKEKGLFKVVLSNGSFLLAKSVVVSTGQGLPYIPESLIPLVQENPSVVAHSSQLSSVSFCEGDEVCVIGGGSSAALVAIKAISEGAKKVVMIHRRQLESRQFELRNEWISPRKGLLQFEFHDQPTAQENLFVVGSYSALEIGPEAFNMMGATRAARLVGRVWLQSREILQETVTLSCKKEEKEGRKQNEKYDRLNNCNMITDHVQ